MIILKRRPIKLGPVHQKMIDEGYTLICDDPIREISTWQRITHKFDFINSYGNRTMNNGRVERIQFCGPNRFTGKLLIDFNGRKYIK